MADELAGKCVVIVLGPLEVGGSERQALLFARYLQEQQRARVQIWGTMGAPGRLAVLCDHYGIAWRIVPTPWENGSYRPRKVLEFAARLRRERPTVVLPYMEMPNVVCGLAWRLAGARLCVWNQRDDGIARINSRHERYATRLTPHFIANSRNSAEHLINERGVPTRRVHVVWNGIELAPPKASRREWQDKLAVRDNSFVAVMVANLTHYKDHATLLRAWRHVAHELAESGRHALLVLAGRFDDQYQATKQLVNELALSDHVRFAGEVDDVSGLLTACDLGVLCSNSEGSPNSAIEYMAAGLPVTGTDIPAMREVMDAESHRWLAPPRDANALAARIVGLASDAELRKRLGAINRARAESAFSPQRMCEETRAVIVKGLQSRGGQNRQPG